MSRKLAHSFLALMSFLGGISTLNTAQADTFCYLGEECTYECHLTKKGQLTCQESCNLVEICEEDGGTGGGSSGDISCYYDQLSGETICPLQG